MLALLPATISGSDITVDPVTAIAGDLFVATGLVIDGVESYPDQDAIRLRREGDGRFDSYFDDAGVPQYPNAKLFIVIDNQARTHIPFTIGTTGGGFNNWNYDAISQESLIEAIVTGDRFLLAVAEPLAPVAHAVDAGDAEFAFTVPQPTVTHTAAGTHAVDAGDVAFAFTIPQPTVTYTPPDSHAVDAGEIEFAFTIPQPTVTYTPAGSSTVDAGDVEFAFTIPQPTVTYTPAGSHAIDAGDVEFAFTIPQPTVTYTAASTSTLAISDWNSVGYQAPIVLALLPATISGADITVDPVTAIAGDLVVASDLTIDGVERYAAQDSIRLRRTGDALFSSYFDNEASPQYPDAKAFIVIDDQARTHVPFTIGATGGGFNNWNYDTISQESLIEAIVTGDRFLLAIAEPLAPVVQTVDAGNVEFVFDLPQPTVTYTPAGSQAVDAGDVEFAFTIPQPTVTYTPAGSHAIDAGDVAFDFAIPQPTVTHTAAVAHDVDAGDVEFAFTIPQPSVTHTPAGSQGVNAGDVAFAFAIPQPTVTYTPAGSQAIDAGDVEFVFTVPQPTVTYTPAGQTVDAGDVEFVFDLPQPTVTYTSPGVQAVDAGDVAFAFTIPQPTVTTGGVRPFTSLVQSAFSQETDEVWLILLTISHADLTDDIRVVHNQVDITSRGMNFVGFAFELSLPIDSPDRAPVAELRIDNVSREIAQAVRSILSAPAVKIEVIRAAAPDVVELSLDGFRLRNVNWDADSVRGALVLDDIATESYPAGIFSPAGFPGLT